MERIHAIMATMLGLSAIVAVPVYAQQPSAASGTIVEKAPGMAEVNRLSIVANVVALNTRTQTVTLRGVDYTADLRVPDKNQFQLIKVGDQVQATYTDAVAASMEPAAKE